MAKCKALTGLVMKGLSLQLNDDHNATYDIVLLIGFKSFFNGFANNVFYSTFKNAF